MSRFELTPSERLIGTAALAVFVLLPPVTYFIRAATRSQESIPHLQTFRRYTSAYSTLRPQALAANASQDFSHTVLPSSLLIPSRDLEPFKLHASVIFSIFDSFEMIPELGPNGVHFSPETDTVIAHCKMGGKINGKSESGAKLVKQGLSEWWTECVLFVKMDRTGREVVEVREFVHSAKAEELKKRLMGVLEGQSDR